MLRRTRRGRIWTPDPVSRDHPLNHGLNAWWLSVPHLEGSPTWWELVRGMRADFTSMTAFGNGWFDVFRPGALARSMRTDGTAGRLNCGNNPALDLIGDLTIAAWVYPTTSGNGIYRTLLSKRNSAGDVNYEITLSNAATIGQGTVLLYTNIVGGAARLYDSGYVLVNNAWTFLVLTIKGTTITLYTGTSAGAFSQVYTTTLLTALVANTGNLGFGRPIDQTVTQYWQGHFDDISIRSRAWSAVEAKEAFTLSRVGYHGMLNRVESSATPPPALSPYQPAAMLLAC